MPGSIEDLIQDPTWAGRVRAARQAGHSYEDIEGRLRQQGVLDTTSTTTTPTTRTFGQALGETGRATAERAIGAGQEYLAQGLLPHSMRAVGSLAGAFAPVIAPEMTVPGMALETIQRMEPGASEAQAAEAARQGQMAGGVSALGYGLGPALVGGTRGLVSRVGQSLRGAKTVEKVAEPTFAAVREAAVAKGASETLAKTGGELDKTTFAKQVRPALRRMLRDAERTAKHGTAAQKTAIEPQLGDLRRLVGRTGSLGPVAAAVSKDPQMLATLIREGGPEALPALQSAWMTGALSAATGKAGLAKGALDTKVLGQMWADLGQEGQRALYGNLAPGLRKFFTNIAETEPVAAGAAAKETPTAAHVFTAAQGLLTGAVGGLAVGAAEKLGVHAMKAFGYAGVPIVGAAWLLKHGGAEWLGDVAVAMRDPRVWTQAAPTLARRGIALLSASEQGAAPMVAPAIRPAFAAAPSPMPAPAAATNVMGNMFPGVGDTYEQIAVSTSARGGRVR